MCSFVALGLGVSQKAFVQFVSGLPRKKKKWDAFSIVTPPWSEESSLLNRAKSFKNSSRRAGKGVSVNLASDVCVWIFSALSTQAVRWSGIFCLQLRSPLCQVGACVRHPLEAVWIRDFGLTHHFSPASKFPLPSSVLAASKVLLELVLSTPTD